jgi:DNA-binding SARP family transcriptional activator
MLLGPFRIVKAGAPLADLPTKANALLAFLAMQSEPVSREKLAELLWPDRQNEQSRQSLRQAIFTIRRNLGDHSEEIIQTNRAWTAISLSRVLVDAHGLRQADDCDALDTLMSRAKLWCGEFLAGFPSISNPFDEWVLLQRSKASDAIARILGKLASLQIRHGHFEAAVGTAQQLVSLDPLREDSHRLLMEIYAKAGRRAEKGLLSQVRISRRSVLDPEEPLG